MNRERTYTIQELADRSRVSPRTIHFYISQGLLPGVGRQGPSTRYPEAHLNALLFIRQLQAQARLSLGEIAAVLRRVPREKIAAIAQGKDELSVADLRSLAVDVTAVSELPAKDSVSLGISALFESGPQDVEPPPRVMLSEPPSADLQSARSRFRRLLRPRGQETEAQSPEEPGPATSPGPRETALRESLAALSQLPGLDIGKTHAGEESWVSIHVSDDLTISARRASPEELHILEQIGTTIREILNRARREAGEKEKK
jgi:DNA-binding transcriptional MerR regulator